MYAGRSVRQLPTAFLAQLANLPDLRPPSLAAAVEEEWNRRREAHEEAVATGTPEPEEPELAANKKWRSDTYFDFNTHRGGERSLGVTSSAKRVFNWMAAHAWLGECYLTKSQIAEGVGLSHYFVRDLLREPREKGFLEVVNPNSRGQFYRVSATGGLGRKTIVDEGASHVG
jgi:hypothetical protein